jgi:hypothetical protein
VHRRVSQLLAVAALLAGLAFVAALLIVYWDRGRSPVSEETAVAIGWGLTALAAAGAAWLAFVLIRRWAFDAHLAGLDDDGARWQRRRHTGYEKFDDLTDAGLVASLGRNMLVLTRRDGTRLRLRLGPADGAALGRILARLRPLPRQSRPPRDLSSMP